MVYINIKGDYRALDRELLRLESMPNLKMQAYLDAVLSAGFKKTQLSVHVVTGSLKTSGKKSSKTVGDEWQGEISYGGVSLGVNNPVTYAIYEKARDENHDFLSPLSTLDSIYVKAILKGLEK